MGFTCDLSRLSETGLIDRLLAGGQKSGYSFLLTGCVNNDAGAVVRYRINAAPLNSTLGSLSFCSDESDTIWYSKSLGEESCFERKLIWTKRDYLDQ